VALDGFYGIGRLRKDCWPDSGGDCGEPRQRTGRFFDLLRLQVQSTYRWRQFAEVLAHTAEKRADGFGYYGFHLVMAQAVAGKVHVRCAVDHALPLAMRLVAEQIVPGRLPRLRTAFERLIAGSSQDQHRLVDAAPGIRRKHNTRAFGRERDIGIKAILTCGRRRDFSHLLRA